MAAPGRAALRRTKFDPAIKGSSLIRGVVVSDLLARFPEKRDHVPHGAPAGHRAESRPDIRLVGTVTGRRFDAQ